MRNRAFGVAAVAAGFVLLLIAEGNAAVLLGGVIVISVGIGFFIYGDGR